MEYGFLWSVFIAVCIVVLLIIIIIAVFLSIIIALKSKKKQAFIPTYIFYPEDKKEYINYIIKSIFKPTIKRRKDRNARIH